MTAPSSFNVSGLLGSNSIDTTALISQLMQAQAIPQTQLKNQLAVQQAVLSAYQGLNTKLTALQSAAQALTDPTSWQATAATSSNSAVVATSDATAVNGTTTFDVVALASAQVSTVPVAANGIVVGTPAAGMTITSADGTVHQIALTTGTASDVAGAINAAAVGVRAAIVTTDTGQVLQLSAASTGTSGAFTVGGLDTAPTTLITAKNAQIAVGDPLAGGYTISSSTNTFTNAIPGVTFSVGALASGVTISVSSDESGISKQVQALVDAANAASTEAGKDSTNGAILQGHFEVHNVALDIMSSVSAGGPNGSSLKSYGIDMDKNGVISFDAAAFAAAYAKDPTGTKAAVSGAFATALSTTSSNAVAPVTGSITQGITAATNESAALNKQIDAWTSRLSVIQTQLQTKYSAMQAALAKLQSQSTWLSSMLKSANSGSNGNSSGG